MFNIYNFSNLLTHFGHRFSAVYNENENAIIDFAIVRPPHVNDSNYQISASTQLQIEYNSRKKLLVVSNILRNYLTVAVVGKTESEVLMEILKCDDIMKSLKCTRIELIYAYKYMYEGSTKNFYKKLGKVKNAENKCAALQLATGDYFVFDDLGE